MKSSVNENGLRPKSGTVKEIISYKNTHVILYCYLDFPNLAQRLIFENEGMLIVTSNNVILPAVKTIFQILDCMSFFKCYF